MRAVAVLVSCLAVLSLEIIACVNVAADDAVPGPEVPDGYYATSPELAEFYEGIGACVFWCGQMAVECLNACLRTREESREELSAPKFKCGKQECMIMFPGPLEKGFKVRFHSSDPASGPHECKMDSTELFLCVKPDPAWTRIVILDHRDKTRETFPLPRSQLQNVKCGGIVILHPFP